MALTTSPKVEAGRAEQGARRSRASGVSRLADPAGDGAVAARGVADLAGEEDEPVGLDDLAEREVARLDAGQDGDGLGHRDSSWLRTQSLQPRFGGGLQPPFRGLDGPPTPPGEIVGGAHPRAERHAVLGVAALAPAAQEQADDRRQVDLDVPVADDGVEVVAPASGRPSGSTGRRPRDIDRDVGSGGSGSSVLFVTRNQPRSTATGARSIICQSMNRSHPKATLASLRSPWRPRAGSSPSAATSGEGSAPRPSTRSTASRAACRSKASQPPGRSDPTGLASRG